MLDQTSSVCVLSGEPDSWSSGQDKWCGNRRGGDTVSVLDPVVLSDRRARVGVREPAGWARSYLRWAALADCVCSLLGGGLALYVRFVSQEGFVPASYLAFAVALPTLWCGSVALAGGYEARFIGAGSDEFRRGLDGAGGLGGGGGMGSFPRQLDLRRGGVLGGVARTAGV